MDGARDSVASWERCWVGGHLPSKRMDGSFAIVNLELLRVGRGVV